MTALNVCLIEQGLLPLPRKTAEIELGPEIGLQQIANDKGNILREDILKHLKATGLSQSNLAGPAISTSKEAIRANHSLQRIEKLTGEREFLIRKLPRLMEHFADGIDVKPDQIEPFLEPVVSSKLTGDLFRLATLLWSVPVSRGFGRRMRYLVRDRNNGKLIGVFALGDPVFNLTARDQWIGWNVDDRRLRMVNIMDAYVVGAVPPYSSLLGGKLVAALIGSTEVNDAFAERYGSSTGIISGAKKGARLSLVTVTSALGRSSLYNRLKLHSPAEVDGNEPLVNLLRIGETKGYGHFHLSNSIFERMRTNLQEEDHGYANGHKFGQGPNWRMRVIRVCLKRLGLNPELIRHGIAREVYALPLATNCLEFLRGEADVAAIDRPSAADIAHAALSRWVIPRAARRPDFIHHRKDDLFRPVFAPEPEC